MRLKKRKLQSFTRFRLMLTLGLAVLLPAAALIYVNFSQLRSFERDKVLEATIHRDFQEMLAISEKKIDKKALTMAEEARDLFPSPVTNAQEKEAKLDALLTKSPWLTHAFLFDEKGFVIRSQPQQLGDEYVRKEHDRMAESFRGWFSMEAKSLVERIQKKTRPIEFYPDQTRRSDGPAYLATAAFVLPQLSRDRVVLGGVSFDPCYLKQTFFPEMLAEIVNEKLSDQSGNQIAIMIYPAEYEGRPEMKPIAVSSGWGDGKPEVARKFDDVFRGLALGIKFQGTSVEAIGRTWVQRSFLILGVLSVLIVG